MKKVDFKWVNGFRCVLLLSMICLAGKLHAGIEVNTFQVSEPEHINASIPKLGEDADGRYVAYTVPPPGSGFDHSAVFFRRITNDSVFGSSELISEGFLLLPSFLVGASGHQILYWERQSTFLNRLIVYLTQSEQSIAVTDVAPIFDGDIHGDYFVYEQIISIGTIVLLNTPGNYLNGIAPTAISRGDQNAASPRIGNRYVVWEQQTRGDGIYDVMAYDLLDKSTQCVICREEISDENPDTSGPYVIFEGDFAGEIALFARNLETNEAHLIQRNNFEGRSYSASIDGDFVAYEFIPDGEEHRQIFLYQLSTRETYQLTNDQCDNTLPDVFADRVTYTQQCDFSSSEVYVSRFEIIPDDPDEDDDGIPDDVDLCPFEDATGLDANADGCIDSLGDLTELVERLLNEEVIDVNMAISLLQKVTIANSTNDNDQENICAAVNVLEAFKNQIEAQRGKKVSDDAADLLIEFTDNVISELLSSGVSC